MHEVDLDARISEDMEMNSAVERQNTLRGFDNTSPIATACQGLSRRRWLGKCTLQPGIPCLLLSANQSRLFDKPLGPEGTINPNNTLPRHQFNTSPSHERWNL